MSMIYDEKKLDFALDLMRRLPPQKLENNLANLIDLVPEISEELLNAIDQPLKIAIDRNLNKEYLLCEYNRDGNSYRSPWSNTYYPSIPDGILPSNRLRKLEIECNDAMKQYVDLYYDSGITSVYLWQTNSGFAGAFLIKSYSDGSSNDAKGFWDSIHVVEVLETDSSKAHYKLTTTVLLWVQTNTNTSGKMNIGGSLMRQKELDLTLKDTSHLANIGRMIEDMENQMRNTLDTVYFDKTRSILNALRDPTHNSEDSNIERLRNEIKTKVTSRQSKSTYF